MCSTPRSKRRVNAKKANGSVGILSSMSSEKRRSFAKRANQANDRRIEAKQLTREAQHHLNKLTLNNNHPQHIKTKTKTNQFWFYWLLKTPFSELMRKLVS
ncbi:MAG: hypothetical protein COB45_06425 [Gammaproteobacteria bacterium]|nr:MAG: hypothetical protein COB45_06425 [Gammaproteobacteria bacterium]PHR82035.1 MAG: hypothetical protein COA59_15130 [Colwellia sp.]